MKKIAIDCRYLGLSGIGRFLEGILDNIEFNDSYFLIGKKQFINKYPCNHIYDDNSPFSKNGLLKIDKRKINTCDVFFTPNFIIPFGIKIPTISMLHDIIFLDFKELNKSFIDLIIKKYLLKRCMKKSKKIFTVSNFSKKRISFYYKKYADKIEYHYPGVSNIFLNQSPTLKKENYIIYVGNIKKNKGLVTLLNAFSIIRSKDKDLKLYIVGDKDSFRNKDNEIDNLLASAGVCFTGRIDDNKLLDLEKKAKFLIQPSIYEGFGSTPLEAIYLGTRPIISNIEVFKEVYSNLDVIYFENKNHIDLANKIMSSQTEFKVNYKEIENKYSYKKYAQILLQYINNFL